MTATKAKSLGKNYLDVHSIGKLPLEVIEWWDHNSCANVWTDADQIETEGVLVRTVGWILRENKIAVSLVATACDGPKFLGNMNILKGTIKSRQRL